MNSNNRNRIDELTTATTSLPAQNAFANGAIIYLDTAPTPDEVHLRLSLPVTPNLVNGQTITAKIQDSDDGINFADVAGLEALVVTGGAGGGLAASKNQRVPLAIRRHVRAVYTASATAGNNTAVSGTFALAY